MTCNQLFGQTGLNYTNVPVIYVADNVTVGKSVMACILQQCYDNVQQNDVQ